jgi:hypothetical protein
MGRFWFAENYKFVIMKTKKMLEKKKLPKGFKFNATLDDKYADQPLFKDKVERSNHILKTIGLPKL